MRLAGRGFASMMPTAGLLCTGGSCAAAWGARMAAACAGKGLASTAPRLCLLPSSDSAANACRSTFFVPMPCCDTQNDVFKGQ